MLPSAKLAKATKYISPSDVPSKFYVKGNDLIFKGDLSWFIIYDFFEFPTGTGVNMIIKLADLNALLSLSGTPNLTIHTSGEIISSNGKHTTRVRYEPSNDIPKLDHPEDDVYSDIPKTIKYGKSIYGNSSSTCSLTAVNKENKGYFIMADSRRVCYTKGDTVPEMDVTNLQMMMSNLAKDDVKVIKTGDTLHILSEKDDCKIRAAVKVHKPVMHKGAELTVQEVQTSNIGTGMRDVVIRIKPSELLDIQNPLTTMNFMGMIYYEVEADPGMEDKPGTEATNPAKLKISFTDASRKSFSANLPCFTNIKGKFRFTCHQMDTSLINFVVAERGKPANLSMKIAIDLSSKGSEMRRGRLMTVTLENQEGDTQVEVIQSVQVTTVGGGG